MALALLLASCGTMPPAEDLGPPPGGPPRYSLVFLIHGDGDYTYHDALGEAHRSDREILARAQSVAERNPEAEVFIFHQVERTHVLFVFPRRDGHAFHYRNGRLLERESYWRDQGATRFAPELRIHRRLAATPSGSTVRMFLYFGHEFPELGETGYDASHRDHRFTAADLSGVVRDMAGGTAKTDLVVLATCFGGTPRTVGALAPHARYVIASPDNLHLSSFDLAPLDGLEIGSDDGAVAALADRFARNAFTRLADAVQTAVSVVVYDVEVARPFLETAVAAYDRSLASFEGRPLSSRERCDCAGETAVARPGMDAGLTVHYRAARFGRQKDRATHSGWECWRAAE